MSNNPKLASEKYEWLKGFREVDFLNLDEQLSQIPVLVQEAAEYAAIAGEIRDTAKDEVAVVMAQSAAKLREAPGSNGKERSEAKIDSELPMDPSVRAAKGILSEARLDAELWNSMVDAMRTKSSALRAGADLIQAGYITQSYITDKRRAKSSYTGLVPKG